MFDESSEAFFLDHRWAVLATTRRDGSPQQSMVGYAVDADRRLIVSVKADTAKWHSALRQPRVSVAIPDGRANLVIYGDAEAIDRDPERAVLTAEVFGRLSDSAPPEPDSILPILDEQRRTVLRITPKRVLFHE